MNKIKLCYLVSSLCNEGPVNVIYNILTEIDYNQFDVSIVTFIPEKENSRLKDFKAFPIKIYQLCPEKKRNIFFTYLSLRRLFARINPDVIHGHCSRPLWQMCFLPRKYKRVYTIHIYPGVQNIAISGWLKGHIIISLDNYFTAKCDMPICCSESISETYRLDKGIEYMAIPNGTSYKVWDYDEDVKNCLRKELGLSSDVRYFISIGRFSQEKHPESLINIFNSIEDRNVGLVMLGDGPLWDEMQSLRENENIIMPGFTTRVADYLKACDYYISASEIEGLANTLLESMSVGLPVMLSDIPSHREVMNKVPYQENVGYIIDPSNKVDVLQKIEKIQLIDKNRSRMVLQKIFQDNYSAQIMTEKYECVYRKIANNDKQ